MNIDACTCWVVLTHPVLWWVHTGGWIIFRSGRHQEALLELQALPPEVASMASLGAFESRSPDGDIVQTHVLEILGFDILMVNQTISNNIQQYQSNNIFWVNDGECPRRLLLKQVIKNNLSRGESERSGRGALGFASFLHSGLAHLASENFQAARDTFEDVLDELEDDYFRLLKCKNDVVLQRTMKSKCRHRSVLRRIWNGFQQRTAMVPPVHASQVPNHLWSLCRMYR